MLHATKRTLQTKHTWTKSISLLLRTLNSLAMVVFLDALTVSSCSMPPTFIYIDRYTTRSWELKLPTPLASTRRAHSGCVPHFKLSSEQKRTAFPRWSVFVCLGVFLFCFAFSPPLSSNDTAVKSRHGSLSQFGDAAEFSEVEYHVGFHCNTHLIPCRRKHVSRDILHPRPRCHQTRQRPLSRIPIRAPAPAKWNRAAHQG